MDRRRFLGDVALAGAAWAATSTVDGFCEPPSRPNLLVILTDDQTFRAIGFNNHQVLTPNLDRLAGEGVIFDHAYISTPICAASRASLLTGVYPQQNGSVGLDSEGFLKSVVEEERYRTPAHLLSAAGYRTGFAGKSHLGDPMEYGFEEGVELRERNDDGAFEAASRFIRARAEDRTPFFFWLATMQPHIPLQPGEEWTDLYREDEIDLPPNFRESPPEGSLYNQGLPGESYHRDSEGTGNFGGVSGGPPRNEEQMRTFIRGYYAAISRLDHQIGELVKVLEDTALIENTAILFLSDNGYHLGSHGLGNKITMHEESVRIPLFLRWGGLPKKGIRTPELVSSLDLYPTLLDLAGVPHPAWLEGQSLLPLTESPDRPLRDAVFSECVGVGGKPGMGHRMARTRKWKYILTDVNEEALFDEEKDPYEMTNLADSGDHLEILRVMRGRLTDWMDRVGDAHERPRAPID